MITEKELNELGKEPFLELVMIIEAFLGNKDFQLIQSKQRTVYHMTKEEEAEFADIFKNKSKPAEIPGEFEVNHTGDDSDTLRIPATVVGKIKGLKLAESFDQLARDGVLKKFVDQWDIDDKARYVTFTYEQNHRGHLKGDHGDPNTGDNNKYWDLILRTRMNAHEVGEYILSIGKTHGKNDGQTLITRDKKSGDYFYGNKRIVMGQDTIYYKVFDALFMLSDQDGFLSYANIDKNLIKKGEKRTMNTRERNKRISNAVSSLGLFKSARVGDEKLKNATPDGRELIQTLRGKGLKMNNQNI